MDMLKSKLQLMKDLSIEYKSSLSSVQFVRDNYETMLDHLESEITQRNFEKQKFTTRTGLAVRELLLQHYNTLVRQIHGSYCLNEELFTHMLSQQQSLQDMINHTEPLMQEMDCLTLFTSQKNLKNSMLKTAISREESIIKGNQRREQPQDRNGRRKNDQSTNKFKLNLLMIEKLGSQGLLDVSEKVWKAQVGELNNLVDRCLESLGEMNFIRQKISPHSRRASPNPPKKANNAGISSLFTLNRQFEAVSHSQSLGLASREEEINLHCDENIDRMFVAQSELRLTEGLTQINEYDEFQESEDFTPRKALNESNISFSERPHQ